VGLVVFIRGLVRDEPQVVIDDQGIHDRRHSFGLIPWSEIRSVIIQSRSAEFIGIELERPSE
jgi:hypothetical protein